MELDPIMLEIDNEIVDRLTQPGFRAMQGMAGTGKSTLIGYMNRQYSTPTRPWGVKTSTTGVSAINVGGTTIHSLLGVYDLKSLIKAYDTNYLAASLKMISYRTSNIIIDEMSMLEADFLDILVIAVEEHNERHPESKLGLVLTGDFGQLPTVNGRPIFLADKWSKFDLIPLTKVHRQADNDFIEALRQVHRGEAYKAIDYFMESIGFHEDILEDFPGPTLYPTNNQVDSENYRRLQTLPGAPREYYSTRRGKQRGEWRQIPEVLELKIGAPVIMLFNRRMDGYMNGDTGIVEEMYADSLVVRLHRGGHMVTVGYNTLDNEKAGSITYLPVRLAWALTNHKIQSQTLDKVQIVFGGTFMGRCHGMGTTSLTRCRTPDGLRLVCPRSKSGDYGTFIKSCFVDSSYLPYLV
jgi:ATP-dependent DNA helicase PIF1